MGGIGWDGRMGWGWENWMGLEERGWDKERYERMGWDRKGISRYKRENDGK